MRRRGLPFASARPRRQHPVNRPLSNTQPTRDFGLPNALGRELADLSVVGPRGRLALVAALGHGQHPLAAVLCSWFMETFPDRQCRASPRPAHRTLSQSRCPNPRPRPQSPCCPLRHGELRTMLGWSAVGRRACCGWAGRSRIRQQGSAKAPRGFLAPSSVLWRIAPLGRRGFHW
jgi:hypothetical protein